MSSSKHHQEILMVLSGAQLILREEWIRIFMHLECINGINFLVIFKYIKDIIWALFHHFTGKMSGKYPKIISSLTLCFYLMSFTVQECPHYLLFGCDTTSQTVESVWKWIWVFESSPVSMNSLVEFQKILIIIHMRRIEYIFLKKIPLP